MIDISFEIGGRKVKPDQIQDALERAVLESMRAHLIDTVGGIRHPETGEQPSVRITGERLDDLRIEVSGSPELIEEVKSRIGTG